MKDSWENFKKYTNFKIIYFLGFASLSSFQPFVSVYLHHFNTIKPSVIGIITCLIPVLSFIGSPLWTGLADKYNIQKGILVLNCSITVIALLLLIPIKNSLVGIFIFISIYSISQAPIYPIVDSFVLKQMGEDAKLYGMQRLFGAISYGLVAFITGILIEKISINLMFISYGFWMVVFLVYFIISQTNMGTKLKKSGASLTNFKKLIEEDSQEVEFDENDNNKKETQEIDQQIQEDEEHINLDDEDDEKSESSGLSSIPNSPILLNNNNENKDKDSLLEKNNDNEELTSIQINEENLIVNEKLSTGKVIRNLLKDPHMMIFLFAVMICGMTANIIGNFLFLYLQDVKHASRILLGSTMPFTVVMELPVFFVGDKLLKVIGTTNMIIVGHLAFIIRLCLYNILNIDSVSPWFVLPIETLHGVAFGTIWGAGIEISNNMAPKGFETIYQGIFNGIYCGLGAGLGSVIGGFLYEHKSPIFLFRFTAIATIISLIIFSITQFYFSKKEKKNLTINN